jgi:hypothetical protein
MFNHKREFHYSHPHRHNFHWNPLAPSAINGTHELPFSDDLYGFSFQSLKLSLFLLMMRECGIVPMNVIHFIIFLHFSI